MTFKIRDKVTLKAELFTDKKPSNGVISRVVKTQELDTGLFTLGLLHFWRESSLYEKTVYTVVREIPAYGDKIRLVFGEYDEEDMIKGWDK